MAAWFVFIRMVSVGVFDSDEFDIFHFRVFPLECDSPRRFSGIRIDGVFRGSFEFVVMESGEKQERLFIGFIEDGEAFVGFYWIEGSEFVEFSSAQCLA